MLGILLRILSDDTCIATLDSREGLHHRIWGSDASMLIIYCTTVFTEGDSDSVLRRCITTLTREYEALSGDSHLMDESLSLECVDDTIECREIHATVSLSDEFFLEVGEGDTRTLTESFDEPFSLFCNTGI